MLCQKCHKNEATVYYKQNINGEIKELALCSECAGAEGGMHLNLFGSLFGTPKTVRREQKRCTLCNSTYDEIRRSGKVGCAECYKVFSDELAQTVKGIHSGAGHCGRAPKGYAEKRKTEDELEALRNQLKQAVANEEYEKAAELRDRIKAMEGGNLNEGY